MPHNSVYNTPADRTYNTPAEQVYNAYNTPADRTYNTPGADRTYNTPADRSVYNAPADRGVYNVPPGHEAEAGMMEGRGGERHYYNMRGVDFNAGRDSVYQMPPGEFHIAWYVVHT